MSGSMMRVTDSLVADIKLLKEVRSVNGKLGTHNDLVHSLVKAELKKTHVLTKNGYISEGAVVRGPLGNPVVVKIVREDMVVLSDDTYYVNGGGDCYHLELLADSVENFGKFK